MTRDELSLLEGVLRAPADDLPRLVYADWLEEHGRPERAEFIRVQCELWKLDPGRTLGCGWQDSKDPAFGSPLAAREGALIEAHGGEWSHDLAERFASRPRGESPRYRENYGYSGCVGVNWGWVRGFVGELELPAETFLAHADALIWHPGQTCGRCEGEGRVADFPVAPDGAYDSCPVCGRRSCDHTLAERGDTVRHECPGCGGCGTRPCPPTAQPVSKVVLTTGPGQAQGVRVWEFQREAILDELQTRFPGVAFELPSTADAYEPFGMVTGAGVPTLVYQGGRWVLPGGAAP